MQANTARFNLIHHTLCIYMVFYRSSLNSQVGIHLCSKGQCVSVGKVNLQEIHKTSAFKTVFPVVCLFPFQKKTTALPGFPKEFARPRSCGICWVFLRCKMGGGDMGGNMSRRTFKPWKIFGLQIRSSKRHRSVPLHRIFRNKDGPKLQLKEFGHDIWFMGLVYLLSHQHQISNIHVRKSTSPKRVLIWSQQESETIHNSWDFAEF